MERNFALEFVRVSEAAAIASARLIGRGKEKEADAAAVAGMRKAFDKINFHGTVRIGEGERDEAPMLYIGEEVGGRQPGCTKLDLAIDPLEGTTICAKGMPNSLSVIAIAEEGKFLYAPDSYMQKIAVGPEAASAIDLDATVRENLTNIARAKKCTAQELTVVVLERQRHESLIREIREVGSRIRLIQDGDVQAAIATTIPGTGVDVLMGTGGAPEGVISAAALKCVGGNFQGRLKFTSDEQRKRAISMGVTDPDKAFAIEELAAGPVMFCASGVTDGTMLRGVKFHKEGASTHSLVMRSETGTVRFIEATHSFIKKSLD